MSRQAVARIGRDDLQHKMIGNDVFNFGSVLTVSTVPSTVPSHLVCGRCSGPFFRLAADDDIAA
jgi:hypothetical protein